MITRGSKKNNNYYYFLKIFMIMYYKNSKDTFCGWPYQSNLPITRIGSATNEIRRLNRSPVQLFCDPKITRQLICDWSCQARNVCKLYIDSIRKNKTLQRGFIFIVQILQNPPNLQLTDSFVDLETVVVCCWATAMFAISWGSLGYIVGFPQIFLSF